MHLKTTEVTTEYFYIQYDHAEFHSGSLFH